MLATLLLVSAHRVWTGILSRLMWPFLARRSILELSIALVRGSDHAQFVKPQHYFPLAMRVPTTMRMMQFIFLHLCALSIWAMPILFIRIQKKAMLILSLVCGNSGGESLAGGARWRSFYQHSMHQRIQ